MVEVKEREVQSLDYAVCELLAALDKLFYGRVSGWKINRNGFSFEAGPGKGPQESTVTIEPRRSSAIVICRFEHHAETGWVAYKGAVTDLNIALTFTFRATFDLVNGLIIEGRGTEDRKFLLALKHVEVVL